MIHSEVLGNEASFKSKWFPLFFKRVKDSQCLWKHKKTCDGAHIKNLFYTFIWNFCPQLIEEGYVYAGVPPLYKITTSKGYKYLKDDNELEKYRAANVGKKYQVGRMKGLGEMDVDEVEETLIHPETRIIKQIKVGDPTKANILFEQLMGQSVPPRKQFIKEYSKEAGIYNAE